MQENFHSSDSEEFTEPPTPYEIKAKGNEFFEKNLIQEALDVWKKALGAALKQGVRDHSAELYNLCTALRLNIALALVKLGQKKDALGHLQVVLDQHPDHVKALFRAAQVYQALEDWDKAIKHLDDLLKEEPGNVEAKNLEQEIKIQKSRDEKSQDTAMRTMFGGFLERQIGQKSEKEEASVESSVISSGPIEALLWQNDDSDLPTSELWTNFYKPEDFNVGQEPPRPFVLSLPLTILNVMETILFSCRRTGDPNKTLSVPVEECDKLQLESCLNQTVVQIHVVGVRGDIEMTCAWSSLLSRLPTNIKELRITFVGFMDKDDPWGQKLRYGVKSPPLRKKLAQENEIPDPSKERSVLCFLFKGFYQDYLAQCPWSNEAKKSVPHIVVVPEPNFSKHFDSWFPVLKEILHKRQSPNNVDTPLLIFAGHSAEGVDSHEALNLQPTLEACGARVVLPIYRNPFSVKMLAPKDAPPMPVKNPDGNEKEPLMWSGPSAKNAVVLAVRGMSSPRESITKEDVESLLESEGVDVKSQRKAVDVLVSEMSVTEK